MRLTAVSCVITRAQPFVSGPSVPIPIYLLTRLHLEALALAALGSTLALMLSPYLSQGRYDSEARGNARLGPTAPAHN